MAEPRRLDALCTPALVTIRGLLAERQVPALRFGDWAAHRGGAPGRYVITLLPLGLCLPPQWCWFPSLRQAVAAMLEIARMKNSWAFVTQEDLTVELGERMRAICLHHGSLPGPMGLTVDADTSVTGRRLSRRPNGYRQAG